MITLMDRLCSRIESCLSLDKKDPTVLHIEVDRVVHYLHEFDLPVAPAGFERYITLFLEKNIIGKIPLGDRATFPVIARMIIKAAEIFLYEGAKHAAPDEPEQLKQMIEEWKARKNETR